MLHFEPLLLTNDGERYATPDRAHIVRGQKLVELFTNALLTELVNDGKEHFWLPTYLTENSSDYRGIYDHFTRNSNYYGPKTLSIPVVQAGELKPMFNKNPSFLPSQSEEWLAKFYNYYLDNKDAFSSREASKNMRLANIVKTAAGQFVSPYKKDDNTRRYEFNVFLPSKKGITIPGINVVDPSMLEKCRGFFEEVLGLEEPDDFEAFKNEISSRATDHSEWNGQQRLEDLMMLVLFMEEDRHQEDALTLLKAMPVIRCHKDSDVAYTKPEEAYMPRDKDGHDNRTMSQATVSVAKNQYERLEMEKLDIHAYSSSGADITELITIASGEYNLFKEGTYEVVLRVDDVMGRVAYFHLTLVVLEFETKIYDSSFIFAGIEEVSHSHDPVGIAYSQGIKEIDFAMTVRLNEDYDSADLDVTWLIYFKIKRWDDNIYVDHGEDPVVVKDCRFDKDGPTTLSMTYRFSYPNY